MEFFVKDNNFVYCICDIQPQPITIFYLMFNLVVMLSTYFLIPIYTILFHTITELRRALRLPDAYLSRGILHKNVIVVVLRAALYPTTR